MTPEAVIDLNLPTGEPLVYELDDDLRPTARRGAGGVRGRSLDPKRALAGAAAVARSAPDGYTLLWASTSVIAIVPAAATNKVSYNPMKDFVPICGFSACSISSRTSSNFFAPRSSIRIR